ncbi:MAG: hypothetical protein ABI443_10260, partial [Chthoniobacterales bacterium]
MRRQLLHFSFFAFSLVALTSCDWMPGKPQSYEKWQSPSKLTAFSKLFAQNCIACHGDGKTISASIPLNDP